MAEGNAPLILTLHNILHGIEVMLEIRGNDITTLEGIVDRCVLMMAEALTPLEFAVTNQKIIYATENELNCNIN